MAKRISQIINPPLAFIARLYNQELAAQHRLLSATLCSLSINKLVFVQIRQRNRLSLALSRRPALSAKIIAQRSAAAAPAFLYPKIL
jgi:hypothetical protein